MAGSHVTLHVAVWVLGHELSAGSKILTGFSGPSDADSWGRVRVSERYGAHCSAQLGWAGYLRQQSGDWLPMLGRG